MVRSYEQELVEWSIISDVCAFRMLVYLDECKAEYVEVAEKLSMYFCTFYYSLSEEDRTAVLMMRPMHDYVR